MRMNKKWVGISLMIIFILITAFKLGFIGADNYTADYGESQLYTKAEMQQAMKVIRKDFTNGSMHASSLQRIAYQDDKTSKSLGEAYDHDKAMAFYVDFHSPKTDISAGPLNPDQDYRNYKYLVYLNEKGEWEIDWRGCGYG